MTSNADDRDDLSRRSFLLSTGGLITAAWLGTQWAAISAAAHHAENMATVAAPARFEFLSAAEAADVDAIAAQIVPGGATPGAREAHTVYFTDRALATFFAAQAAEFRVGLTDLQAKFHAAYLEPVSFAAAAPAEQNAFLHTVDRTPVFESLRMLTLLGMFASPTYGGNYQSRGWTLLGFEDRHSFTPPFGYYDARYSGFTPYAQNSGEGGLELGTV